MKLKSLAFIPFLLLSLAFAASSAMADTISFSTQGSWDDISFYSQTTPRKYPPGNASHDFTVVFSGMSYAGTLPVSDEIDFGVFTFTLSGDGANAPDTTFYLRISQTDPSQGGTLDFQATLGGKVGKNEDKKPLTLTFLNPPLTIGSLTYTLDNSGIFSINTGNAPHCPVPLHITGLVAGLSSPPDGPVAPEPSSLILLGTGLLGVALASWRQRKL